MRGPANALSVRRTGGKGEFVSITPPGFGRYSIDKYLSRDELPFSCDGELFEVRILTVAESYRGTPAGAWEGRDATEFGSEGSLGRGDLLLMSGIFDLRAPIW